MCINQPMPWATWFRTVPPVDSMHRNSTSNRTMIPGKYGPWKTIYVDKLGCMRIDFHVHHHTSFCWRSKIYWFNSRCEIHETKLSFRLRTITVFLASSDINKTCTSTFGQRNPEHVCNSSGRIQIFHVGRNTTNPTVQYLRDLHIYGIYISRDITETAMFIYSKNLEVR